MRRRGLILMLVAASLVWSVAAAAAAPGTTERVSVASDGTQGNSISALSSVSGDGRYVAFNSPASNLVPGDTNGTIDVFVHDRAAGATTRVSVATDGTQGDRGSSFPSISGDGRYVAFHSAATNLVPGDSTATGDDVFVHDRATGTTTLASVAMGGGPAGGAENDFPAAISGDGRYIAFVGGNNLVPGDTNGTLDVFVHDRVTGSTERVSVASDGSQGNFGGVDPAISSDGRYVAFSSRSTNLVPGDTNGASDVFVRDRAAGTTGRVSVATDGTEGDSPSGGNAANAVSGDGRYVAFTSSASNLVPGDTNGTGDIFVHDRATGTTSRVSVATDGTQSNGSSRRPAVSGDGRYVAFGSSASNLVPGDTNGAEDVFVHDRAAGTTARVSVATDGTESNGGSGGAAINGDGRYVSFSSSASNLVAGDTNGTTDVFVRDREGTDTTAPTVTVPDPVTVDATGPDGATVTFAAAATDDTDPSPTLSCAPPSGGTFPIGSTTVTCTATDAAGNQATGSFTVTVVGAAGQLEDLEALIVAYPLKPTVEASLLNKVTGAQDALAAGKTSAACSKLADFLNQVADFRSARKLTAAQATELTADATRIRTVLGC